ncbi:MAG: 16S rRNA (guanine(527)-N(7))-methyltransferase RsmG [Dehalococcoidia bacterium]
MEILIRGAQRLGLPLSPAQVERFEVYYRELIDWNRRVNLTRIIGREEVQVKHFLDSLTVAKALPSPVPPGLRALDIGSGAGLPGVPLKILYPKMEMCLMDSVGKKTAFLEHLVATLGLEGVQVVTGRAETLAHDEAYRERFDLVVSRAVTVLAALLELTLPFCKIGGRVIAQKDASYEREPGDVDRALALLGGRLEEVLPIELEGISNERRLVVISKAESTPGKYPRRPGVPARRPL